MIVSKVQKQPKSNKVVASKTSPVVETTTSGISASKQAIRERAFQMYEGRGCEPGHDIQDWLRAENHILAR